MVEGHFKPRKLILLWIQVNLMRQHLVERIVERWMDMRSRPGCCKWIGEENNKDKDIDRRGSG